MHLIYIVILILSDELRLDFCLIKFQEIYILCMFFVAPFKVIFILLFTFSPTFFLLNVRFVRSFLISMQLLNSKAFHLILTVIFCIIYHLIIIYDNMSVCTKTIEKEINLLIFLHGFSIYHAHNHYI